MLNLTPRVALRAVLLGTMVVAVGCSEDPMAPLPSDTVGPDGGDVVLDGGLVKLAVPAGALSTQVTFTAAVTGAADAALGQSTPRFTLGPAGTEFAEPVTVRLRIDPAALIDQARMEHLVAGVWVEAESAWQGLPESSIDTATGELVFQVSAFDPPVLEDVVDEDPGAKRMGAVSVGHGPYRGDAFAGLFPIYTTPVGGTDVAACGSEVLPCRTMSFAMGKARFGDRVVLLGPATFTEASALLHVPSNVRMEGEGNPTLMDVSLRFTSSPSRAHVRGVAVENTNPGSLQAAYVSAGTPVLERITSRSSLGIELVGGRATVKGCNLRDTAAHIEVRAGDHEIDGNTIRDGSGAAITLQQSSTADIKNNTLRGNWAGVFKPYLAHLNIDNNTITGNEIGVYMGHDPPYNHPTLDPPSCSATLTRNTIQGNTRAGVLLSTTGQVNVRNQAFENNTWDSSPPDRWNGPAPWIGSPDIVDTFAQLGGLRWWEVQGQSPSARIGAAMGYDDDLGQAILFGGLGSSGVLSDTWSFDFGSLQWQRLNNVVPPPGRTDHVMTGGPVSARCFLFGGRDNGTPEVYFDDLWVLDPVIEEWIRLNPAPNPDGRRPGPRYGASFVQLNGDHYLLYGGLAPNGGSYAEWWVYDAAADAWTDRTDNLNLPPFRGFTAAVNAGGDVLAYGGNDAAGNPLSLLYRYQWGPGGNTNAWGELLGAHPAARSFASLQRVSEGTSGTSRYLLFGGATGGFQSAFTNDTFLLDWNSFEQRGSWQRLLLDDARKPPARGRHASWSWRGPHGYACIIFGGTDGATSSLLNDTWVYMAGGDR